MTSPTGAQPSQQYMQGQHAQHRYQYYGHDPNVTGWCVLLVSLSNSIHLLLFLTPGSSTIARNKCKNIYNYVSVTSDMCLMGCVFVLVLEERTVDVHTQAEWKLLIELYGGVVDSAYSVRCTHLITNSIQHTTVRQVNYHTFAACNLNLN